LLDETDLSKEISKRVGNHTDLWGSLRGDFKSELDCLTQFINWSITQSKEWAVEREKKRRESWVQQEDKEKESVK